MNCVICRGAGVIRLPVYRPMRVVPTPTASLVEEDLVREYPCPECTALIPQERLAVVEYHSMIDGYQAGPEFFNYAKRHSAHQFAQMLLDRGFISFEKGPDDEARMTASLRATIGVVSPTYVATLKQRIAANQAVIAQEVVDEAIRQIRNWNSHYSGDSGPISKAQATGEVRGALQSVLAKHQTRLEELEKRQPPPMTQGMIEAGISAYGSDDDRPTAERVLDIWIAMNDAVKRESYTLAATDF